MRILNIGAGAYSIYYAEKGDHVTSIELVRRNVNIIKSKVVSEKNENWCRIRWCVRFNFMFRTTLSFSYRLGEAKMYWGSKKGLQKNTKIFFAYISNDMAFITEQYYTTIII